MDEHALDRNYERLAWAMLLQATREACGQSLGFITSGNKTMQRALRKKAALEARRWLKGPDARAWAGLLGLDNLDDLICRLEAREWRINTDYYAEIGLLARKEHAALDPDLYAKVADAYLAGATRKELSQEYDVPVTQVRRALDHVGARKVRSRR